MDGGAQPQRQALEPGQPLGAPTDLHPLHRAPRGPSRHSSTIASTASRSPSNTASTVPSDTVAHRPGHAPLAGRPADGVPEEHSLDAAVHDHADAGGLAHTLRAFTTKGDCATWRPRREQTPPGAWTRSMGRCSTSCSAPRTTSAGCPPARSRARRSRRASRSATRTRVRQHAEMVSVYEEAGVRVHLLEPDPALPYQVFARDSLDQRARRRRSSPSAPSGGGAASTRP